MASTCKSTKKGSLLPIKLSSNSTAAAITTTSSLSTTKNSNDRQQRRRRKHANQYRSSRAVRPPSHAVTQWTRVKILLLLIGLTALAMVTIVPMYLLLPSAVGGGESTTTAEVSHDGNKNKMIVGLSDLMENSRKIQQNWKNFVKEEKNILEEVLHFRNNNEEERIPKETQKSTEEGELRSQQQKQQIEQIEASTQKPSNNSNNQIITVKPPSTAILEGAQKGRIENCLEDVSDMVYWNDPQGTRDLIFKSPFAEESEDASSSKPKKFLTFEPDCGGWNNVRMSLETILVLAVTTGRTLVLPPKTPLYLIGFGAAGARTFGDFLPLFTRDPLPIPIITMSQFVKEYGSTLLEITDPSELQHVQTLSKMCLYSKNESTHCIGLWKHLRRVGWQPPLTTMKQCLIFDQAVFESVEDDISDDPTVLDGIDRFCKQGRDGDREVIYYNAPKWTAPILWHWVSEEDSKTGPTDYRLLNHFYTTVHFTDPVIDHYLKRWIRDYVHYNDEIICTAGRIIHAIEDLASSNEMENNSNNTANNSDKRIDSNSIGWSAWHVRRGDFQYKVTRYSIEEWYNSTRDFMKEGEFLYIATDEKNTTFFEPLKKHYKLLFMSDFESLLPSNMEPSYRGMIETLVASHGRTFTGTWFSTYSGYINRLRGYLGRSMKDSWYSFRSRREKMRHWEYPNGNYPAREWPIAWTGIDTDEWNEGDEEEEDEELERKKNRNDTPEDGFDLEEETSVNDRGGPDHKADRDDNISAENVIISHEAVEHNRQVPLQDMKLSKFHSDGEFAFKAVARGMAGRPMDQTPALKGARRAQIEDCQLNIDSLAYWNNPQGTFDETFQSPFAVENDGTEKFLTFGMDRGGWNNIRMSMEIIFVLALMTKRTLVLPPETKLYLMHHDTKKRTRSYADFFPLHNPDFKKRVNIITMEDFIKRGAIPLPEDVQNATIIRKAAKHCDKRAKSENSCFTISNFLENSAGYLPEFRAVDGCIIFDEQIFSSSSLPPPQQHSLFQTNIKEFCGERKITYWKKDFNDPALMHIRSDHKEYRLLTHFYSMLYFTNPTVDNFVKRFVRDFLHYNDEIFCAAGKIIKALQFEVSSAGSSSAVDSEGAGGYSALHIRRGDLQFKKVKLPAHIWWNNTQELFQSNELLYIATDEQNKSWFDPITQHRPVRFLDDYWDLANLSGVDPNLMGMIDAIVASRGRVFVGTWFSTFSGYINRMRGYHGMSMLDSWYSFPSRKTAVHTWERVDHYVYAYEYPTGWIGIDANIPPDKTIF